MNTSTQNTVMQKGSPQLQNFLVKRTNSAQHLKKRHLCFSCEQTFPTRERLEEHFCPSASYICSCGTEFSVYVDMLEHSTTHEPGHQVLDHETIKKRRIETSIKEKEQLKRLQFSQGVPVRTKLSSPLTLNYQTQMPIKSGVKPQTSMQSALASKVPGLHPTITQTSGFPNPYPTQISMQNVFAGVGSPTVDLWTIYQPVVLVKTVRKFNKQKPYTCSKCGQGFLTKNSLITHHSEHVTDKVSGCIGCGMLLSSKKLMPRFHACNAPSSSAKVRLITARPLSHLNKNAAGIPGSPNLSASSKIRRAFHPNSSLQQKSHNLSAPNKIRQGPPAPPSLHRYPSNKHSQGLPFTSSQELKTPNQTVAQFLYQHSHASSETARYLCRVCHLPFESAQLLQRHKCAKAQEFMAQHSKAGKPYNRIRTVTPVKSPNPPAVNGERRLASFLPAGGIKANKVVNASQGGDQGATPVNGKTVNLDDDDDDCYIVESSDKSAEVIYQVTSSVPVKT
ncbi:zinc finger protein 567-like isoform X2 [Thalassophryne amazonica]|nr:zinc finger protein 567-like isoform X2 [Thalassophryne amazonica]XP_034031005.1 zinc finger protein 567-like isoform X2 [Thalassophryne amazonica]XP_034031006.1 zinc finger protein 567-like isoform X2 [Thalassophryne amazonica]